MTRAAIRDEVASLKAFDKLEEIHRADALAGTATARQAASNKLRGD